MTSNFSLALHLPPDGAPPLPHGNFTQEPLPHPPRLHPGPRALQPPYEAFYQEI